MNLSERIRAEIESERSISFERFMELALYAPGEGYYTRDRDPFGREGDFYTAEQLQPVFGILIANFIRASCAALGSPQDFRVVELGAGRADMREAFKEFDYIPVDVGRGVMPKRFTGVILANEFFDALPVHLVVRRRKKFLERRVTLDQGRFQFVDGSVVTGRIADYVTRWHANAAERAVIEVNLRALDAIDEIANRLSRGYVVVIDYGYTSAEARWRPEGSLMSYRRHTATEDVLADPGERDITAHAPFTVIEEYAAERGFTRERFETLACFLLSIGEPDQFASAIAAENEAESFRRRMQLKTLLFGMGETFRVLLLRREAC